MSTTMTIVITDAGLAEIVNAEQSGTAPVVLSHIAFGSAQYTASPEQTALKAEFKRFNAIAGGGIGDNLIHLSVNDKDADAYAVYEVGVFTQSGTLFAVYSQNTPIVQKVAASEIMLAIDILVTQFSPESVVVGDTSFVLNPATHERAGVIELATDAETIAGTDDTRAVSPASLAKLTGTTGRRGLLELATSAETIAGTDTTRAVTPSGLTAAFVKSHADTGFQKLPNGFIIQWGKATIANGDTGTNIVFPATFPNACKAVSALSIGGVAVSYRTGTQTAGSVVLKHNGNGGVETYWTAIGF